MRDISFCGDALGTSQVVLVKEDAVQVCPLKEKGEYLARLQSSVLSVGLTIK